MAAVDPQVYLRLGSHAEKEYLEKTLRYFDGLILGANLVEATPGATSSLLVKFAGRKRNIPYLIDPMTYAFGTYIDRDSGRVREDLDWIKSEQKVRKKIVRTVKRSYAKLAPRYGELISQAVNSSRAIVPEALVAAATPEFCRRVVAYQMERLKEEFEADEELQKFADEVPTPAAVLAPYFYVEPSREEEWLQTNVRLAKQTVEATPGIPVHAVLCADSSVLLKADVMNGLVQQLPETGIAGVWLWFSRFWEERASLGELRILRELTEQLSSRMSVYNLHGGFFSLALCKYGMSGISHGVGYGEQKDVIPVIGQSTPMVRYYVPPLKVRHGVPDIQICLDKLGVRTAQQFFERVCDCVVCKGVLGADLRKLDAFGEMHLSRPVAKRQAQTPAAAKRCRFHFLLNRIKERDQLRDQDATSVAGRLQTTFEEWRSVDAIDRGVGHLERWAAILR
jgi:hypothetical protein